jgi:hypothetical protein
MPAILQPKSFDIWLDRGTDVAFEEAPAAFCGLPNEKSPGQCRVNLTENNNSELIKRIDVEVGTTPSLF